MRCAPSSGAEHSAGFISHGVRFRLLAESDALLDMMKAQAPHGTAFVGQLPVDARTFALRRTQQESGYEVFADQDRMEAVLTLDQALTSLGSRIMIHVAEHAPEFVFLHAGVVAWGGHALLLPGVSHAGKSTLVAELVRRGATYYSDEFALLDEEGRVHPFARDIGMRKPGSEEQVAVSIARIGGGVGTEPLPVSLVVFAEFAERGRWAPQAMTPGQAVLEMLRHSTPVQRTPQRVLAALSVMMRHATAWRSQRGEAADAAGPLLSMLTAGVPPA